MPPKRHRCFEKVVDQSTPNLLGTLSDRRYSPRTKMVQISLRFGTTAAQSPDSLSWAIRPKSHFLIPIVKKIRWVVGMSLGMFKYLLWPIVWYTFDGRPRRSLVVISWSIHMVSSTRRSTFGDREFPMEAAARVWNSLSPSVRSTSSLASFCLHLKTHLFAASFPRWHSTPS